MGAGRLLGEVAIPPAGGLESEESRREEWMEGLLKDEGSWELLSEAWMEGLLREEDKPKKKKSDKTVLSERKKRRENYNSPL